MLFLVIRQEENILLKKVNKYCKINRMANFINSNINKDNIASIKSTHISTLLQENSIAELKKIYDFYASEQSLLLLTGFGGTGKRLIIEHSEGFLATNVLRVEYDCKAATVCDDILLYFIDIMQKTPDAKKILSPKIENFAKTLNRYISVSSFPILIFINAFNNIQEKNAKLILDFLFSAANYDKVKIILTAKTFDSSLIPADVCYTKIISKPLNRVLFSEYFRSKNIEFNETEIEELYKLTRGYYFYAKLTSNVITNMGITLKEFLLRCKNSGKIFDRYLCDIAISVLPLPIRNFFWFLLLLRHGISYDALSVLDLYDENSVKYLLKNGYIYETSGIIYVSDYFHSDVEIIIPVKIKQKLHRYLADIYKTQLKEKPENRVLKISRQSLNTESEYHTAQAESTDELVNTISQPQEIKPADEHPNTEKNVINDAKINEEDLIKRAEEYTASHKYTDAAETYKNLLNIVQDKRRLVDLYLALARVYSKTSDWSKALHYFTLAKDFFTDNNEPINVNYIKYELSNVYYNMFNLDTARKLLKEVIFSQDSPNALMIDSCLQLGNIEDYAQNYEEAFVYYKQGVDSINETTPKDTSNELYFRYAVALDEHGEKELAISYYKKYINSGAQTYLSPVYCNLGTMSEEDGDIKKAEEYFKKAYDLDTAKNNYDGIYYSSTHLANLYFEKTPSKALPYIKMAQNSAETLNDSFYIAQSHLLAGDYYYRVNDNERALKEYIGVYINVKDDFSKENLKKITARIKDMEIRLGSEKYTEIMKSYG